MESHTHTGSISVLLGNGNGTFQTRTDFRRRARESRLDRGDLTGDGKLDLVAANRSSSGGLSVLTGNGNGTFQSALRW